MPDKTAFMSADRAAFVYSCYRGIRYIKRHLVPENQFEWKKLMFLLKF